MEKTGQPSILSYCSYRIWNCLWLWAHVCLPFFPEANVSKQHQLVLSSTEPQLAEISWNLWVCGWGLNLVCTKPSWGQSGREDGGEGRGEAFGGFFSFPHSSGDRVYGQALDQLAEYHWGQGGRGVKPPLWPAQNLARVCLEGVRGKPSEAFPLSPCAWARSREKSLRASCLLPITGRPQLGPGRGLAMSPGQAEMGEKLSRAPCLLPLLPTKQICVPLGRVQPSPLLFPPKPELRHVARGIFLRRNRE